jgi:hypothetical protein
MIERIKSRFYWARMVHLHGEQFIYIAFKENWDYGRPKNKKSFNNNNKSFERFV